MAFRNQVEEFALELCKEESKLDYDRMADLIKEYEGYAIRALEKEDEALALEIAQKVADYTYKKAIYTAETIELKALPWFKNYRILSIILLIATTILVGFFW